jgi:hypothetical protein
MEANTMMNEAISKLKTETEQNQNNPYIKFVGEQLINFIKANPDTAEKFLDQDKSIGKSLDVMRKAAEKKKVGNCAVLTDEEGFEIVLKYFDVKGVIPESTTNFKEETLKFTAQPEHKAEVNFDIDLEDLL